MHFPPILKYSRIKYLFLTLTVISLLLVSIKCFFAFKEQSYGPFQSIDKYSEAQAIFDACNEKTLVTFDVDDTLIAASDVMANLDFPLWFKIRAITRYPQLLLNKYKMESMQSLIFQQAERFVFDPDIVNIIQQTQCHGSKVIALTSMESGSYGCIESMPEWRASMLSNFGINFNKEFQDISFTSLPLYRGQHPCLYKGVLCANQQKKGTVLGAFLDYYNLKPERIISFDDQTSALNSIAQACAQRKINFTGYQMLGAKKLHRQWVMDRALVQLDSLMQHSEWLRDKDADYSMKVKAATLDDLPLIPRTVLFGNPEKTNPQISPDGKRLAYIAPINGVLNVWVKTIGKNDDRLVSSDSNRGIYNAWWAHDNKHILYLQDKGGNENWHIFRIDPESKQKVDLTPFDNVRVSVYASSKKFPNELLIGMNKDNKLLFDVYRLNIETGKIEFVEKNTGNIENWVADNNFKIRAARTMNEDGSVTLLIRNTEKDAWREAITWKLEDGFSGDTKDAGFSPDNKKLYLQDARKSNTAQFIEYDIESGSEKVLVHDPLFDVNNLNCDSENKPLAARINKERAYRIALDPKFGTHLNNMLAIDDGDLSICNHSDDDRYWIVYFEHDNGSAAYYLYDKETQKSEFLFYPQPKLNEYKLSEMEPISFTSRDGLKIHGYLTCPLGKERKNLPLVLSVHGGPWWRDMWGYNPEVQWFANRGYACLQVNYRGSAGYGKDFLNAGDRESGGKMHNDLIDAVNWAVTQGIADPKKIAIWGMSYGGYFALVGATFTPDVFCCAVDICGPCNLVTAIKSFMPSMVNLRKQFYLRVGDPEKDVAFLKSCSPLFKIDNIKIPILIGHGANDVRVSQVEAEQIVEAMKAKGLPYEYVLFPDEGHGFLKPENRLKFYAIAERFLAKHLGGRVEG